MKRTVTCSIDLGLTGPARLVYSVAVAAGIPLADESFTLTVDGAPVLPTEITDVHGTRLHTAYVDGSTASMRYEAVVDGIDAVPVVGDADDIVYLRPSRYCESDSLAPTAASEFTGLSGLDLLQAVISWVNDKLTYVTGSSLPTDGAVRTLLARQGVCRDFAHLSIALLRALNVPARLAAVYAPGLSPMEFHAVAEALVDGQWWVVDATQLAPRQSLLRVATGRDAADTAFLTNFGAATQLNGLEVTAVVDDFALDDTTKLTQLR
ncbi:transglutaminase-like domain-containing protein [Microlunatus ginsengisoli]|uniref:transglutaminase-like domain-containing protein n=1 Tax=Microlunatus ginsengisoli TaxID=363863 RepID=UPI003CD0743B